MLPPKKGLDLKKSLPNPEKGSVGGRGPKYMGRAAPATGGLSKGRRGSLGRKESPALKGALGRKEGLAPRRAGHGGGALGPPEPVGGGAASKGNMCRELRPHRGAGWSAGPGLCVEGTRFPP